MCPGRVWSESAHIGLDLARLLHSASHSVHTYTSSALRQPISYSKSSTVRLLMQHICLCSRRRLGALLALASISPESTPLLTTPPVVLSISFISSISLLGQHFSYRTSTHAARPPRTLLWLRLRCVMERFSTRPDANMRTCRTDIQPRKSAVGASKEQRGEWHKV